MIKEQRVDTSFCSSCFQLSTTAKERSQSLPEALPPLSFSSSSEGFLGLLPRNLCVGVTGSHYVAQDVDYF